RDPEVRHHFGPRGRDVVAQDVRNEARQHQQREDAPANGGRSIHRWRSGGGFDGAGARIQFAAWLSSLNTRPPLMTVFTSCSRLVSFNGSPCTVTRSPNRPASRAPTLSSQPM